MEVRLPFIWEEKLMETNSAKEVEQIIKEFLKLNHFSR